MFLLFWYYIAILSIVFWLCFLTHYVTIQCTTEGRTSKLMDQTTAKNKIKNTNPQSIEHCHDHQLQVHVLCISLNPTPVTTVKNK